MKRWQVRWAMIVCCFLLGNPLYATESGQDPAVPVAVAETRSYTFDPVPEGTDVQHHFVIENHGNAPLEIERVHTG